MLGLQPKPVAKDMFGMKLLVPKKFAKPPHNQEVARKNCMRELAYAMEIISVPSEEDTPVPAPEDMFATPTQKHIKPGEMSNDHFDVVVDLQAKYASKGLPMGTWNDPIGAPRWLLVRIGAPPDRNGWCPHVTCGTAVLCGSFTGGGLVASSLEGALSGLDSRVLSCSFNKT